jgi:hypothetical protein
MAHSAPAVAIRTQESLRSSPGRKAEHSDSNQKQKVAAERLRQQCAERLFAVSRSRVRSDRAQCRKIRRD